MHRFRFVHALRCIGSASFAFALLLLCTVGCATGSSSTGGNKAHSEPIRIRYLAYASGQRLELVNPAHTDPTELYSNTRPLADAGRKVSSAEVMDETLKYFRDHGFFDKSEAGPAPPTAEGVWSQSLEVETPGRLVHLSIHRGTTDADRKLFLECAQAFVTIYNNTYQLQSVDQAPDWSPKRSQPAQKSGNGGSGGGLP